jgi:hypothetical protein
MATDLKSRTEAGLTRFWGGEDRGSCVQVTLAKHRSQSTGPADKFFDSVQLTREQAGQLAADLLAFSKGEEEELF